MTSVSYKRGRSGLWLREQAALYESHLQLYGSTATIIPIGDPKHGLLSAATFKTVGAEQRVVTPSEPLADWDTKPGQKNGVPIISWNGTDEQMSLGDATYFTRALAAMSLTAWVNPASVTTKALFTKRTSTDDKREWRWNFDSAGKVILILEDENAAANESISSLADTATALNAWIHLVATYDGTADASGINLYANGVLAASTDTDAANFLSMRDTAAAPSLGTVSEGTAWWYSGKMAGGPLGPAFVQAALSGDAVLRLYELGRRALNL